MNTDSFTDEQLLNLVNNTILEKTEFDPSDFTGGSVQATTSYKNKIITMKVILMFGYDKNNNSRSFQCEILDEAYYIWARAILQKTNSMLTKNTGAGLNELNKLMNSKFEKAVLDNKIVDIDRDRVSTNHSTNNSNSRNEVVTKDSKYEKERDFSLKTPATINSVSEEYYDNLEIFLKAYIEDIAMKRIHTGSKLPEPMSFDEFVSALRSSGKKYGNFVATYRTWLQRDASERLSK